MIANKRITGSINVVVISGSKVKFQAKQIIGKHEMNIIVSLGNPCKDITDVINPKDVKSLH